MRQMTRAMLMLLLLETLAAAANKAYAPREQTVFDVDAGGS